MSVDIKKRASEVMEKEFVYYSIADDEIFIVKRDSEFIFLFSNSKVENKMRWIIYESEKFINEAIFLDEL